MMKNINHEIKNVKSFVLGILCTNICMPSFLKLLHVMRKLKTCACEHTS